MDAVGTGEQRGYRVDARIILRRRGAFARADRPRQALDLILAGFNNQADEVIRIRQRAQFCEGRAFIGTRPRDEVVARGKIELAAGDVGRRVRRRRIQRSEPAASIAGDDIAERARRTGDDTFGQRRGNGLGVGHSLVRFGSYTIVCK